MLPKILELGAKLPTGLDDDKAMIKFQNEREELIIALAEALLEAADGYYYAWKAWYNGLATVGERQKMLADICRLSGFSYELIESAAIAKYSLRARPGNPKDKVAELESVMQMMRDFVENR